MFFTALKNSLEKVKFNGHPICAIVGSNLGSRLVEKFVLRLCAAAANSKVLDEDKNKRYKKLVEDFDAFMKVSAYMLPNIATFQRLGYFVDNSFSASEVFKQSSRLIVNQRCRVFLASARAHVFKPSVDLVRVKGLDFDWTKDEHEISDQLSQLSIEKEDLVNGMDSEKFFAFRECSIRWVATSVCIMSVVCLARQRRRLFRYLENF